MDRITIRLDEETAKWLGELSEASGLPVSSTAREVLKLTRMSEGARRGYQESLKYLLTLEPSEVLQGIDALIEAIKEVQKDA